MPEESFLGYVAGVMGVADKTGYQIQNSALILDHQCVKRLLVSALHPFTSNWSDVSGFVVTPA